MKIEELMIRVPQYQTELETSGMVILRDVQRPGDDELEQFASRFSHAPEGSPRLLTWNFGVVMKMNYDENATNYLFSAGRVPLHWDGPFHVEPSYILFYCDASDGDGGETILVDTRALMRELDSTQRERWGKVKITYRTEKRAHYGGSFSSAIVREHPRLPQMVLRFCEVVDSELNPLEIEIEGGYDWLYEEIVAETYNPRYVYRHSWNSGDLLLVDNHTYLHGREPLGSNTIRSFRRVHIL
jgi:alpha-ketoglutarate-dependent taurine dioxygenase